MPLDPVALLADLIALPSVNPMGRAVSGEQYFEHRVTDYLEQLALRQNWPYERRTVAPRRDNLLIYFEGEPGPLDGGKLYLFEAHQDTVPTDGMTIPPWEPAIRDGRIYGRGSCDIKGGMAAMIAALANVCQDRPTPRPSVLLACTVNEEHGYTGALALAELWKRGARSILPRKPDAAIVAEPTELNVVTAHKGAVRWRLRTAGKASHSSQPETGDNAIYAMAPVLTALEEYQRSATKEIPAHPLCGGATLSVGMISGGISVNTVPADCAIEIDRRLIPGETPESGLAHVKNFLAGQIGVSKPIFHEPPYLVGRPLADEQNADIAQRMLAAARTVAPQARIIGVPYGTDAATFAAAGVPSIVFGPGSIAQAHTADEWLSLEQLQLGVRAYEQFCRHADD